MERKALYAGSFDPITNGHLNIIERAAGMYDALTVAIAVNPNKSGLFTVEERAEIIKEVTKHISNVRVDIFTGLIADYVNENGFDAYVRGLRSAADFESELHMSQMNARLFKGNTETVFLMTAPEYSFVSSSLVKEAALFGGNVDGLVPPCVSERIKDKMTKQK
jgi:pantetheine-phosphate adenylyltransferase